MEPAEQLALMDSLSRLAHALGEELFARASEQADDCEEDDPFDNTIPIPVEAFEDAGLWGKSLHIRSIDGAVVITEDTSDVDQVGDLMDSLGEYSYDAAVLLNLMNRILRTGDAEGFDGYNGDLTGDVSATLGVNCGMSTGRNGLLHPIAFAANQRDEVRDLHDVAGALAHSRV